MTKQPCLQAENEQLRAGYDAARLEIESLQKAATDRHALQATGAHPAPCARYCEAVAFNIERRNLHAENERLRTCNKDAQHEIANLQERVQELGQMARDVNSRRVQELEAQLAAVAAPKKWAPEEVADGGRGIRWVTNEGVHGRPTDHDVREYLKRTPTANGCHCDDCKRFYAAASDVTAAPAQAGEYPPLVCDYCGALTPDPWHSSGMLHGKMSKHIHSCDVCAARGAAQAAPEDASARFKAQHEFLIWNREQTPSPIESATEYSVFNQAVDFYLAARAAQGGA